MLAVILQPKDQFTFHTQSNRPIGERLQAQTHEQILKLKMYSATLKLTCWDINVHPATCFLSTG